MFVLLDNVHIFEPMIRANGKTTRTVDKAIQVLFKKGAIKVPLTLDNIETISWDTGCLIYDPACKYKKALTSNIQRELCNLIKGRLQNEHRGAKLEICNNIFKIIK
jgi:hypothetical protein